MSTLPARFDNVEHLEDVMTTPSARAGGGAARRAGRHPGARRRRQDGPDAGAPGQARRAGQARDRRGALLASRACGERSSGTASNASSADLLSREQLAALPDVPNIVFMAGRKFGSTGSEWLTWAMNAHVPALVAERYRGLAHRRVLHRLRLPVRRRRRPAERTESAPLTPPPGEYANSCVARERMFQHFSHQHGTAGV